MGRRKEKQETVICLFENAATKSVDSDFTWDWCYMFKFKSSNLEAVRSCEGCKGKNEKEVGVESFKFSF